MSCPKAGWFFFETVDVVKSGIIIDYGINLEITESLLTSVLFSKLCDNKSIFMLVHISLKNCQSLFR